jgi:alpha-galactosidase
MGFATDDFPFKKYLAPGDTFVSPKGFLMPYKGDVWQEAFENGLAQFTRKYLGVKLFERKTIPTFFYNTWNPFKSKISSALIRQIADAGSAAGVEYLIMDDGWQNYYGDWETNTKKFPEGLKPVCDYIISKGMKPGLWISAAHVENKSRVFAEHPEWLVRNRENAPANLHAVIPADCNTMCLATPWYDYIKGKIISLVKENNIGYIKFDLASAYSAYKLNNYEAGCYASGHGHKDQAESLYMLYTKTYQLIDELKASCPDLYVDCTFELFGEIYGIDYSLVQHADGDWLSNIEQKPPHGPLYLRQLSFERGRVIPPSTLLIGNMQMNWENSELGFQSLFSASPLMLGDPRGLPEAKIAWFKKSSDWFRNMETKYRISQYYQTSNVFTRPESRGWDGFARINPDKGGLVCVFRNDDPNEQRKFQIPWVNKNKTYRIKTAVDGRVLETRKGSDLMENGLLIEIPKKNQASVLELEQTEP